MWRLFGNLTVILGFLLAVACSGPSVTSSNTTDPNQPAAGLAKKEIDRKPAEETLVAGTTIRASFESALSTESSVPGDTFVMKVVDSVKVNERTVIPIGSTIRGVVAESVRSGRVKGLAHMTLKFTELTLPNGKTHPIEISSVARTAPNSKKRDAMVIGGGAGIGGLVGAIAGGGKGAAIGAAVGGGSGTGVVLATRGKETGFPAGSTLNLKLTQPLKMTLS